MKAFYFLCIFSLVIFGACHTDDEGIPVVPEEKPTLSGDTLAWEPGFPMIFTGTRSLKLYARITHPGLIYFVVSDHELNNPTPVQIKELAKAAQIGDGGVLGGVVEVLAENLPDTTVVEVEGLSSGKNYFTYSILQGQEEGDSVNISTKEDIVERVSYMQSREKEESFASAKRGKEIKYLFYALEDYYVNPHNRYPLLIFLHGKGEYGEGGSLSFYKNGTIPELIHDGKEFPFVIISPQIDTGRWDPDFVDEFLNYVLDQYKVDENRIYMTGNSLGGVGTWEYAGLYPEKLAAIVPISGHGDTLQACNIKDIPTWAFHNSEDGIVATQGSIDMVEAIKACDPPAAIAPKLTIYPEPGHDAWVGTYDGSAGHDIYTWMLSYSR